VRAGSRSDRSYDLKIALLTELLDVTGVYTVRRLILSLILVKLVAGCRSGLVAHNVTMLTLVDLETGLYAGNILGSNENDVVCIGVKGGGSNERDYSYGNIFALIILNCYVVGKASVLISVNINRGVRSCSTGSLVNGNATILIGTVLVNITKVCTSGVNNNSLELVTGGLGEDSIGPTTVVTEIYAVAVVYTVNLAILGNNYIVITLIMVVLSDGLLASLTLVGNLTAGSGLLTINFVAVRTINSIFYLLDSFVLLIYELVELVTVVTLVNSISTLIGAGRLLCINDLGAVDILVVVASAIGNKDLNGLCVLATLTGVKSFTGNEITVNNLGLLLYLGEFPSMRSLRLSGAILVPTIEGLFTLRALILSLTAKAGLVNEIMSSLGISLDNIGSVAVSTLNVSNTPGALLTVNGNVFALVLLLVIYPSMLGLFYEIGKELFATSITFVNLIANLVTLCRNSLNKSAFTIVECVRELTTSAHCRKRRRRYERQDHDRSQHKS
jgi:hypothetical protein